MAFGPAFRPPTWALFALAALAVVALSAWSIAACGPWDPWETHYGEVARQILLRSDPLDLWWKPGVGPDGNAENTFWSKPALPFWLMALSMKLLGVGLGAAPDEMVRAPWPELAIRLPSMLTGLTCAVFLGWACARLLAAARPADPGQPVRAGFYTALALVTMPQWAVVSRQALTDMFFVAPVTLAMAAWALAWLRPDRPLRRRALVTLLPRRLRARFVNRDDGPNGHVPSDMSKRPSTSVARAAAASAPASDDMSREPGTSTDDLSAPTASPALAVRADGADLPRAAAAPGLELRAAEAARADLSLPPAGTARLGELPLPPASPAGTARPGDLSLPPAGTASLHDLSLPPAAPAATGWRARLAGVARWTVPWDAAYLGFFLLFLLAVVAPIVALDLHVSSDHTVARVSRFVKKPGVPNFATLVKIHLVMLGYAAVALLVLLRTFRWRTRAQVWMGVLYLAAGVSLVGKGMIGPGLVGLLVLLHLLVSGRLTLTNLWRCGPLTGLLLFALASLPWHHAMWIYRGDSWLNELIIVNNLARFGSGEQDQAVGGFAYYLRTLGVAALPWSAALPAALWAAARHLRESGAPGHVPSDMAQSTGPGGHALATSTAATPAPSSSELWRFALLWFCATLALLTTSVTKYYHYLLPTLPPLALLLGLWLSEPAPAAQGRKLAWAAAGLGTALLALVLRDAIVEPAWITHLTTYLYDHMWRNGAPETTGLVACALPFALGLALWAARRQQAALVAMLLAGFITLHYTLNSYLPAVSEHWSQRSAIRHYYDHRGPDDPLASWWFYYRGETFFTKGAVWVQKEADRETLAELIDANRGHGRNVWLITTGGHGARAKSSLPADLRSRTEVAYENAHYTLLKVPVP
ncbi:ArnT family glycosyltransferase [Nannocystis pusilla]|uniref:ArnT family glycosyltransferase n=1 Tax=Nannocystis pusilla TaxID=889268 RepID=UPI003DA3C3E4